MTIEELSRELRRELDHMERVVLELQALAEDVGPGRATLREKAAAGPFLASFYMGVENVLKRIARFHDLEVPRSERWHVELFEWYCEPPHARLPVLFDDRTAVQMGGYRRFRHVVHHGYELDLAWERMREGVQQSPTVYEAFRGRIEQYLRALP